MIIGLLLASIMVLAACSSGEARRVPGEAIKKTGPGSSGSARGPDLTITNIWSADTATVGEPLMVVYFVKNIGSKQARNFFNGLQSGEAYNDYWKFTTLIQAVKIPMVIDTVCSSLKHIHLITKLSGSSI